MERRKGREEEAEDCPREASLAVVTLSMLCLLIPDRFCYRLIAFDA
jgi:hypothetical protein